jgi:hypothetical protein
MGGLQRLQSLDGTQIEESASARADGGRESSDLSGIEGALPSRMTPAELKARTFQFSLDCYRLARPWFREHETRHVAQQLVRASSSVAQTTAQPASADRTLNSPRKLA